MLPSSLALPLVESASQIKVGYRREHRHRGAHAYFPFSGWKDSFLGMLHGQGRDALEFYTDKKVVIERWPKEWSRKF